MPAAAIGAIQGALLTAVVAFAVDLSPGGWVAFTALAMLGGVAFAALNQALAAAFGGIGRFVAMVVAVVALSTAVISTVPALLSDIAGALPTATVLDGLRGVIDGTSASAGPWSCSCCGPCSGWR